MGDPLKVECPHCLGTLKLKDRSADGKKVRCPKCEEVFKVTLPDDDQDSLDDDFLDDELPMDEEEAPRKSRGGAKKTVKKKGKSRGTPLPWMLIGLAVVGLIALCGLGFVVAQFMTTGGTNKIDLAYLPSNANMVLRLKVADMMNSPLLADVMKHPAIEQNIAQQGQQVGVSIRDMQLMTVGVVMDEQAMGLRMPGLNQFAPAGTPPRYVTVIRCTAPMNAEQIGKNVLKGAALTYNGQTYYKRPPSPMVSSASGDSLYFPEPTVAVLALEADIKQVIDQGPKPVRRPEYDFVNPDSTLLLAYAPKLRPNPDAAISSPASRPNLQALERATNKTVRGGAFGMKVSDLLSLEILVKCADSTGAGELKSATDAVFSDLKNEFQKSKGMLTLMGMDDVVSLVDKSLGSLSVTQSGTMVTATGSVPSELRTVAENLSKKLPGMMGMPDAGPGSDSALPGQPPTAGQNFPDPSQLPTGSLPPEAIPAGTLPTGIPDPAGVTPPAVPAGAPPASP